MLVLQLGTHSFKLGFANDRHPVKVEAIVARKLSAPREIPPSDALFTSE